MYFAGAQIVKATAIYSLSACLIEMQLFCRFTDVTVGFPELTYEDFTTIKMTPQQCRLRDLTYSAQVRVDIEFIKGRETIVAKGKNGVGHTLIGRMPIMLRSDR